MKTVLALIIVSSHIFAGSCCSSQKALGVPFQPAAKYLNATIHYAQPIQRSTRQELEEEILAEAAAQTEQSSRRGSQTLEKNKRITVYIPVHVAQKIINASLK